MPDYKTHCNFPGQDETGVAEQVVVSSPTLQCWSLFGLLPQRSQITVFGAVAAAAAAPAEVSAADEASSPTSCNSSSNAPSIASAHTPTFVRLGTSTFRQQSLCPRGHKDKNKFQPSTTFSRFRVPASHIFARHPSRQGCSDTLIHLADCFFGTTSLRLSRCMQAASQRLQFLIVQFV